MHQSCAAPPPNALTNVRKVFAPFCHKRPSLRSFHMLVSLMAANDWAGRERPDRSSRFNLCKFQVVPCLQVHPELWGVTEPMSKPQRRVTSDPTFAVDYLSDPISRDGKLTRQLSRRHTNSFKTLGENSSRMMDCCGHIAPRNGQAIPTDDKVLDDVRQSYIN
ncbi:hypothetical protein PANN_48640 [Pseudomonas aeruginosa C-NN2]|nr:hypothetical protein PANN_48640 [Pseudomonas aeruginosa C-NN2]